VGRKAGQREIGLSRRAPAVRDTRERVLSAALEVFTERGYQAATVEEIAERAGMTKGAVYYWFRDKEDLASDIQAELWTQIATEAQRVLDPDANAIDNLKLAFRGYLLSLDNSAQARFFLRDCWAVASLDAANREQLEMGVRLVQQLVDEGIRRDDIVDVDAETFTRVLLGAFAEATLHVLTKGRSEQAIEVVERLIDGFAVERRPAMSGGPRRSG
jgi:TetR/AcrR family transcriptional regulator